MKTVAQFAGDGTIGGKGVGDQRDLAIERGT